MVPRYDLSENFGTRVLTRQIDICPSLQMITEAPKTSQKQVLELSYYVNHRKGTQISSL